MRVTDQKTGNGTPRASETGQPAKGRLNAYGRIARTCWRYARLVIVVYVLVAIASVAIAVSNLRLDTDTGKMIAADLPFRQDFADLNRTFPAQDNVFVVVVDAAEPERGRQAAKALARSFRTRPDLFQNVYAPGTSDFFDDFGILYLPFDDVAKITDDLDRAAPMFQGLADSPNLAGLSDLIAQIRTAAERGIKVPDSIIAFLAETQATVAGEADGKPRALDWEKIGGGGNYVTRNRWFVIVKPALNYAQIDAAETALAEARTILDSSEIRRFSGVKMALTGEVAVNGEEFGAVEKGAKVAAITSFVLVTIVISLGMPAIRLIIPALLMLVCGFSLNAAFATLAVGHLNMISVAFAVFFIGLGIDYAVHILLRYSELARSGQTPMASMALAVSRAGPALGLCTMTTSLAFLAFTPTNFVGMAQLGIIAAGGIIIALLTSLTLIPAAVALVPLPRKWTKAPRSQTARSPARLPGFLRFATTGVVLIAAVGSVMLLPSVRFDGDPIGLKDPATPSVIAFNALLKSDPGQSYAAQILVKNADEARPLAAELARLPAVAKVMSADTFVPEEQRRKLDRLNLLDGVIPAEVNQTPDIGARARRASLESLKTGLIGLAEVTAVSKKIRGAALDLVAELDRLDSGAKAEDGTLKGLESNMFVRLPALLGKLSKLATMDPLTVDTIDPEVRNRYIAPDGRWRITAEPAVNVRDEKELREFVRQVRTLASGATGTPVEVTGAANVVSRAMIIACLSAMGLVILVLLPVLRRPLDIALVLTPIILAGLLLLGYTALFDSPFNFANVIVLPLLLGLGIDSSIHYVMRAREVPGFADITGSSTPRAVTVSALTTVGSFGTLWLSPHRGMSSMGELLTVAILFTLVCTLIVLPQLIKWSSAMTAAKVPGGRT